MIDNIKIGVALGGGAFRGLAHIGVLQTLEKYGVFPDIVVGTSMGAMVGGVYSCGVDLNLLERYAYTLNEKELIDLVVPREGFIEGRKIELLTRTLTGNRTFEQTVKKFAAVATDLYKGERVVIQEGLLYQAIRASISIPGIFTPYNLNGRLMVDGGVVDRVPYTAARELGADFVIGVDVGYHGEETTCNGIMGTVLHVLEVMEWKIMEKTIDTADVSLSVPVSGVNAASTAQARECIAEGRDCAEKMMPEILEKIKRKKKELLAAE